MIKKVKISNFKSVQELEIELGKINVFIGENGCGKTSILEAIVMAGAAMQDKLDNEFISSRGVRVTDPSLMKSAFSVGTDKVEISLDEDEFTDMKFVLTPNKEIEYSWHVSLTLEGSDIIKSMLTLDQTLNRDKLIERIVDEGLQDMADKNRDIEQIKKNIEKAIKTVFKEKFSKPIEEFMPSYFSKLSTPNFLLYAPENYFLRRFEEEGQIRPLGIRGEGLFRHLVELSKEEKDTFKAITKELNLIDWYEGFNIPTDLSFSERRISITDRFISDTIKNFDQRSANEGFLYLLFYFTLFLSKYTPKFFAIDNIDNSLNPRLCSKLVERLSQLAKEYDKQVIFTTHNPAILDGLNLDDDDQRLFVIFRNADGETKARRIKPLTKKDNEEPVRLSEAFVRGYLGGLPSNF